MQKTHLFFAILMSVIGGDLVAAELSNMALYNRCHSQLTQMRPSFTDPLTMAVEKGSIDPVKACLEILDRAIFDDGTSISDPSDATARAVLNNMHRLHDSWFLIKDINIPAQAGYIKDFFDTTSPAGYFTKALFDKDFRFEKIVTHTLNLRPIRTNSDSTRGPNSNLPKDRYAYDSFEFAGTGELIGIEETDQLARTYSYKNAKGETLRDSVQMGKTLGGGFLGTAAYLLMTVQEPYTLKSNGALMMPRKWAKAAFWDTMCRDLPAIRPEDADLYVNAGSSTPFRQARGCVACHASMDQAAATIRNFYYQPKILTNTASGNLPANLTGPFAGSFTPTKAKEAAWPTEPDASYHERPPNGLLYYRNYAGKLINIPVTSLSDLGAKMSLQDDMYICAAKRYFAYFTGLDAKIGDLNGAELKPEEIEIRNTVIELGKKLKEHQSLRTLIEDIFKMPRYRRDNFL